MKKLNWNKPEISNLAVANTTEPDTLDLGHGYDEYNHVHFCSCGLMFNTWAEAKAHENEMTLAGLSRYHMIGCDIFKS